MVFFTLPVIFRSIVIKRSGWKKTKSIKNRAKDRELEQGLKYNIPMSFEVKYSQEIGQMEDP